MKIAFFETKPWEEEYLKQKLSNHELIFSPDPITSEKLPANLDFEVLSVFVSSKVDEALLNQLPNLKFIATRTTGFDQIDLAKTTQKNIPVANVPTYGEITVAEYAFALILSLSRKVHLAYTQVKEQQSFATDNLQGFDLMGKTIGVVGTGHIGVNVIKIAKGFGMKVLAFDAYPNQNLMTDLGFEYTDLENLLKNSDVVTLHVPYLPSTHHLINKNNISLMKKSAVLINTARGAVMETDALFDALKNKNIAGAALDVLEDESELKDKTKKPADEEVVQEDLAMTQMDNVIITPHNAFNTKEAMTRILDTTCENILSFKSGSLKNIVALKKT